MKLSSVARPRGRDSSFDAIGHGLWDLVSCAPATIRLESLPLSADLAVRRDLVRLGAHSLAFARNVVWNDHAGPARRCKRSLGRVVDLDHVVKYHLPSGLAGFEETNTGAAIVKGSPPRVSREPTRLVQEAGTDWLVPVPVPVPALRRRYHR